MALDADDIKKIADLIAASNAELKKSMVDSDAVGKMLDARDAKTSKAIEEKLAEAAKVKPADDAKAKPKDGDVPAPLQARLDALERETKEAKEAAASEKAQRETAEQLNAFETAAIAAGVAPERVRGARAVLHLEEKRIGYTTDGKPGLKFNRKGYDEILPMADGLKEWLSTDEGKAYLPPTGSQGTGGGKGAPNTTTNGEVSAASILNGAGF